MTAGHAFFDESGTHQGSPVLCVAGYVIEEDRLDGHGSDSEADRIMHLAFFDREDRAPFGYTSHAFVDKLSAPGVQAADLLAWQMYTDWRHGMEGRPRRKDFAALISDKKHRVCLVDAKRILYHVGRMKEQGAWDGIEKHPKNSRAPNA